VGEISPFVKPGASSALAASIACQPMANVLFDQAWGDIDPRALAAARTGLETVRSYPGRLGWAASVMLDHAVHLDELDDAIHVILSWAARPDPRPPGSRADASGATVYQPPLLGLGLDDE
jgi:hypothetical protein